LVFYAVYAEWEKTKQLPPAFFGYAVTVETNSGKSIKVWIFLMRLGAITGCHQMNQRSLFFRGYQFPVCARCTGLFVGQTAGLVFALLMAGAVSHAALFDIKILGLCAGLSVMALGIDGFFQLKKIWVSTNVRRFVTGLFCGFFVCCFLVKVIMMIRAFFCSVF